MATLVITPRYGPSSSPRDLNFWALRRVMEAWSVVVEHGKRHANGEVHLKLSPDHPIPPGVLGLSYIEGVEVDISLPEHLNLVKGVIHHPELALMDQDVVLEMLREHHVVAVRKPPQAAYAIVSWSRSASAGVPATVLVGWDIVAAATAASNMGT